MNSESIKTEDTGRSVLVYVLAWRHYMPTLSQSELTFYNDMSNKVFAFPNSSEPPGPLAQNISQIFGKTCFLPLKTDDGLLTTFKGKTFSFSTSMTFFLILLMTVRSMTVSSQRGIP